MILNLRGTHGSGKSTAVMSLIKKFGSTRLSPIPATSKRPEAYALIVSGLKRPVFVIGPYTSQCGGCDAIQPYARIWPLVVEYAKRGHVVFEGALVSCSLGSIGEAMVKRKKDCVVAYLDTPLEVCVERIVARRAKKGNDKPLNSKNTELKFKSIGNTRPRFEAAGVRCVTINYKKAAAQLLALLQEAG